MEGYAAGGPVGATLGGGGGLIGGLLGQSEAKTEAKKRLTAQIQVLQAAYCEQQSQIVMLGALSRPSPLASPSDALRRTIAEEVKRNRGYGHYETSILAIAAATRL